MTVTTRGAVVVTTYHENKLTGLQKFINAIVGYAPSLLGRFHQENRTTRTEYTRNGIPLSAQEIETFEAEQKAREEREAASPFAAFFDERRAGARPLTIAIEAGPHGIAYKSVPNKDGTITPLPADFVAHNERARGGRDDIAFSIRCDSPPMSSGSCSGTKGCCTTFNETRLKSVEDDIRALVTPRKPKVASNDLK